MSGDLATESQRDLVQCAEYSAVGYGNTDAWTCASALVAKAHYTRLVVWLSSSGTRPDTTSERRYDSLE
jgi:hypothetical protein